MAIFIHGSDRTRVCHDVIGITNAPGALKRQGRTGGNLKVPPCEIRQLCLLQKPLLPYWSKQHHHFYSPRPPTR